MAQSSGCLKLYYDLMSQPARALYMFLRLNGIPFERQPISIKEGEHLTDSYRSINRFAKIPCIVDTDGFRLAETPAILQYLVATRPSSAIAAHWYPLAAQERARVDEYLSWQHMNTRLHCSMFFWLNWLLPKVMGRKASARRLQESLVQMEQTLDTIETVWLGAGQRFIAGGERISIADLLAVCELEQTKLADYDVSVGRPNIKRWMELVRAETQPHYDEAHKILWKIVAHGKQQQQQEQQTSSKL